MTDPGCERTVLIVEDDVDTSEAIAEVLEDRDYRPVRAVQSSSSAAEIGRAHV